VGDRELAVESWLVTREPDRETRPPSERLDRQPVRLSDKEID